VTVKKPPNAGKGRPKGSKNKAPLKLQEAIAYAFEKAGGGDYLLKIAQDDPRTFCGLLAKMLPIALAGDKESPIEIHVTADKLRSEIERKLARIAEPPETEGLAGQPDT